MPILASVKQMVEYEELVAVLYKFIDNYHQIYILMKDLLEAQCDQFKNSNSFYVQEKDLRKFKIARCQDKLAILKVKEKAFLEVHQLEGSIQSFGRFRYIGCPQEINSIF